MQTQAGQETRFVDVAQNRRAKRYSLGEMILRVLWGLGQWAFWIPPRPCFGWRRFVLRCFGAKIGREVHVYRTARIYFPWNLEVGDWSAVGEEVLIYNLGKVTLGAQATVSHRAHLCAGTHDYSRRELPLLKLPIVVGDEAWICADAFIGPGVRIGRGAVVGARAVVVKDVDALWVVAGNPAVKIKERCFRPS